MNTFSIERGGDFASNIILSNNEDHPEFVEVHFIEDLAEDYSPGNILSEVLRGLL